MRAGIPERATRKEKLLFLLRAAGFAVLLAALLSYALYVLVPKYDYGICSMTNLYRQEENTVDVLVLGTSLAYAGVNTNVLWEEYGIAAYDLCCAEQPYWISYAYLREALKTQQPRAIVLDAKASTYKEEYSKRGRTFLSTTGIADPLMRLSAIRDSVPRKDFMSFVLGFPQLHSYYPEIRAENFAYPPDNAGRGFDWKGYIESTETEKHSRPSLVWAQTRKPLGSRQEEYLRKILGLARQEGIPVMIVGIPNPDYASDHLFYNSLWDVADEYGAAHINYNDPQIRFGLTYTSCFSDWQHLNVKGSILFSRQLGADLKRLFDLPDRRGEARYHSWEACAESWYAQYPEHEPVRDEKGEAT